MSVEEVSDRVQLALRGNTDSRLFTEVMTCQTGLMMDRIAKTSKVQPA